MDAVYDFTRGLSSGFAGTVRAAEPLHAHTTQRIGGPCALYIVVDDGASLAEACERCAACGMPWVVMGKGSGVLVSDKGFAGAVICLGTGFRQVLFDEATNTMTAGAGALLSSAVRVAAAQGASGLEFAAGIPGTVGGALRCSVSQGRETLSSLVASIVTFRAGEGLKRYLPRDMEWGAHGPSIPYDEVIIECELALAPDDREHVAHKTETALARRRTTQPLAQASCAALFADPDRLSAGRLIENVGLAGAMCGGAQLCEHNANFAVNNGGASAAEVLALVHAAADAVKQRYDCDLEPEVRFLGFE